MKLVVLGGGESGVGAALLGRHLGYEVFLSDKGKLAESYRDELITHRIAFAGRAEGRICPSALYGRYQDTGGSCSKRS